MSRPRLLVVGSTVLDRVFRLPRLPFPGETIMAQSLETYPGGKGANQAVAVAKLGGDVGFVGCIGDDEAGVAIRSSMEAAGVDLTHLHVVPGPTGSACIYVDRVGNNMIAAASGANAMISVEMVESAMAPGSHRLALAQLEMPLTAVAAAARTRRFVLNPAPGAVLPAELLARCYALTPNETELHIMTGIPPVDREACLQGAGMLLDQGALNVIVTLGERGSIWMHEGGAETFPAPPVKSVDSTAAGDAFNGALALFLAQGRELKNAIPLANCAGALATTKPGAQPSMPTLDELKGIAGDLY